ncbi:Sodium-dependent dicarboxylate transporter SdcS [Pseudoalteromonas holothuriae]|uniref:Sodium-dependent dicarboxylate transporter SdcS n=1 Tax=Pseudoalteromonas holothuriae TaxID=2963714 RepID=A0ABM9GEE5_9GAMM|nr:DASS family sodium-coupled anion symporter [Pseudoalteromonas sp. CIP111951]CAH9050672.1 Sodium-dependent dicarboxylate transporter SdcS [Pseudoalteromonas sp. CIP111951]
MKENNNSNTNHFLLFLAPSIFLLTCLTQAPTDLSPQAWRTAGLAIWLAIWWVSEVVPIPVTSLVPLLAIPLAGINDIKSASSLYAHPLIFLFLGGFLISIAMEKWQLHKRIALHTMLRCGNNARIQILAMMLVSGFLSMWINNTATTLMMLPIALSVIHVLQENKSNCDNYGKALLLAIAYSASIGGVGTIIGTAPNALMAAYLWENHQIKIGFAQWMVLAVPFSMLMIILSWVWLTRFAFKVKTTSSEVDLAALFANQLNSLGKMSLAEKNVFVVFLFAAVSWILRPYLALWSGLDITDTGIAIAASILLFVLPSGKPHQRIMDWQSANQLPWGILLLFGGGLTLASQIKGSGLADYIANSLSGASLVPIVVGVLLVAALICFLTELTSNTATAAGFLPLLGPIAEQVAGTPLIWVIPAAIAASCAFMMPVATPPNAIVFGSGELKIKDMIKAGFAMNIIAILLITMLTMTVGGWLFGF